MNAPFAAAALCVAAAFWSPRIASALPAGGCRGTELEVVLRGERLVDPLGIVGDTDGLELLAAAADRPEQCTLRLRIAADTVLGARTLRLHTAGGLSNPFQFRVGVLPMVRRAADQAVSTIPLDCTVDAELAPSTTDRYRVSVAAATAVTCEIEAQRLGFAAIDLALAVLGPDGVELAANDDNAFAHKDPWLQFHAAVAGDYEVRVRAATAGEADRGVYRLHVGTFARPVAVLPAGGQPGERLRATLLGGGEPRPCDVALPDRPGLAVPWFPDADGRVPPTPVWLRVGGPPNATATVDERGRLCAVFPGSVHGVVAAPGTAVTHWFHADQGDELSFLAVARTLRSPLDPVLTIVTADGRRLASNDDQASYGLDSQLRFRAEAAGDYGVEVRDALRTGSPLHVFRLEAERPGSAPRLRLVTGRRDDAALAVPRGGAIGAVLQWNGVDAAAATTLALAALPAGVTATFGPVRAGTNLVPLLLAAAAEAPRGAAMAEFTAARGAPPVAFAAGYLQELPLVLVRNDQPLVKAQQTSLPVAVVDAAPFALELLAPTVPIVRGAPLSLRAVVRRGDCKERIRLRALWTPPGLEAGQVTIEPGASEAQVPLSASAEALLGTFPFALIASIGGGRTGRCDLASGFVDLQVVEPPLSLQIADARGEPGQQLALRVQVTHAQAATATAPWRARLVGLPRGVTAADCEVPAGATEVVFALQLGADAAPGRHRGWQLEARLPVAGGELVCRGRGAELRIDERLPTATGEVAR